MSSYPVHVSLFNNLSGERRDNAITTLLSLQKHGNGITSYQPSGSSRCQSLIDLASLGVVSIVVQNEQGITVQFPPLAVTPAIDDLPPERMANAIRELRFLRENLTGNTEAWNYGCDSRPYQAVLDLQAAGLVEFTPSNLPHFVRVTIRRRLRGAK